MTDSITVSKEDYLKAILDRGDQPFTPQWMQQVFDEYWASERRFRTTFDGYQRYHNLNRLFRPSIVKLGLGLLALAHRRRGTWA